MNNEKKSLVFFGSGPVAAESLKLLSSDFEIEAVVTKPTTKSEMSSYVPGVPIHTVTSKQELDDLITSEKFNSELGVLIDFGIIVGRKTIEYFKFGIINSHFSLLPELRGADPISFAILEGKDKTGVSLMLLVEAMDEGPILSVAMLDLDGSESTPSLTKELIMLSYELLKDNIPKYYSGEIVPVTQEVTQKKFNLITSYTKKLKKEDGIINWNKPAIQIDREIRAYLGWPKSTTQLANTNVIITKVCCNSSNRKGSRPGDIQIKNNKILVQTLDGQICIEKLKPIGKSEMDTRAFLAGYKNRL